jgi:flagellar hook-basal body complex protein FliE
VSQLEVDRVLAQIRALQSATRTAGSIAPTAAGQVSGASFANVLQQGIERVNAQQAKASAMQTAFERGVPGVELPQVMLEAQKASVSFRALTEVRNRFVEAYREIMNMPL